MNNKIQTDQDKNTAPTNRGHDQDRHPESEMHSYEKQQFFFTRSHNVVRKKGYGVVLSSVATINLILLEVAPA